jgi:hypothetical protein
MLECFKQRGKIVELISRLISQIKLYEVNLHREKSPSLTEVKRTMLRQVVIERPPKFISIWLCVCVCVKAGGNWRVGRMLVWECKCVLVRDCYLRVYINYHPLNEKEQRRSALLKSRIPTWQGVTKRCRLSWLTYIALIYEHFYSSVL